MAYYKKVKVYTIKRVLLISVCVVLAAGIGYSGFTAYYGKPSVKTGKISGAASMNQSETLKIARAKLAMKQGELPDESKIEMVEVPAELVPQNAVSSLSKLRGMRLKRDISEKEFLNAACLMPGEALYEDSDRLTEHNFAEGTVPDAVSKGSTIDIKLFVRGGEDCIVVSKALVISRSANLLSFYLDGREQELIKEAAAEGLLFAVLYLDSSQKASEVTYIPIYERRRDN